MHPHAGQYDIEEGQAEVADHRQALAENGHLPQPAQGSRLDLIGQQPGQQIAHHTGGKEHPCIHQRAAPGLQRTQDEGGADQQIGRASCRERV